jgi:hypothetical protein
MDKFVKECKIIKPNCFILAKVDIEKLCITAKTRTDSGCIDIDHKVTIPVDLLDPVELDAASEGEDEAEMVCLS